MLGEFPAPFHASDGFFYAAENRVYFGLGIINGLSLVIGPYGRIIAVGAINERGVIGGEIFTASGKTRYTLFSDWFGWLMIIGLAGLLVVSHPRPE